MLILLMFVSIIQKYVLELNKMGYRLICWECGKYMKLYFTKIKDQFIQCPECRNSTFKIEVVKGSHHESTSYKIICIRCNEYFALSYSKVKELSFRFIQCPICKQFTFKIEIIKGKVIHKLNKRTKDLYEKYDNK